MRRKSTASPRHVRPWKHNLATDRGYSARVERAVARGEYTHPGTQPNAMDADKCKRKRLARQIAQMGQS